jgi:hypothetical protein
MAAPFHVISHCGVGGVVQVSSTARTRAKKASEQRQAPPPPPLAAAVAITATAEKRTRRTRPETPSRSPPACWSPHVCTSSLFGSYVSCACVRVRCAGDKKKKGRNAHRTQQCCGVCTDTWLVWLARRGDCPSRDRARGGHHRGVLRSEPTRRARPLGCRLASSIIIVVRLRGMLLTRVRVRLCVCGCACGSVRQPA